MSAIGIDFGTSFSSASWIDASGRPAVITFNENGRTKLPSVVSFTRDGKPQVGEGPYTQITDFMSGMSDKDREYVLRSTILSIKRHMRQNGIIHLPSGQEYTHTQIISFILKKIKEQAAMSCNIRTPIDEVTLTHPVVFEEWKKEMLRQAAKEAGFTKVTLLEEPISAAIGYLKSNNLQSKGLIVYDFGGGTFDIAYVKSEADGTYHIPIAPLGDQQCGGDDIDLLMYKEWDRMAHSRLQRGITGTSSIDRGFLSQCRKNKESLSLMESYVFNEILPPPGLDRLRMEMDRARFNTLVQPVVEKTIRLTQQMMDEIRGAGLPLDHVILIGGSSRIPLVEEKLREILSPIVPSHTGIVDTAVALGSSYYHLGLSPVVHENNECYCDKCGKKINRLFKFCIYCGTPNFLYKK
jgi:molecular chaperone DnaK